MLMFAECGGQWRIFERKLIGPTFKGYFRSSSIATCVRGPLPSGDKFFNDPKTLDKNVFFTKDYNCTELNYYMKIDLVIVTENFTNMLP